MLITSIEIQLIVPLVTVVKINEKRLGSLYNDDEEKKVNIFLLPYMLPKNIMRLTFSILTLHVAFILPPYILI